MYTVPFSHCNELWVPADAAFHTIVDNTVSKDAFYEQVSSMMEKMADDMNQMEAQSKITEQVHEAVCDYYNFKEKDMRMPQKCDEFLAKWLKLVDSIVKELPVKKGGGFAKFEGAIRDRKTIKKIAREMAQHKKKDNDDDEHSHELSDGV